MEAFGRAFQRDLSNRAAWWLIEMHSKYPDTFNAGAWEGSCGPLSIDKLYACRDIPVGQFVEWNAAGRPGVSKEERQRRADLIDDIAKRAKRKGWIFKTKHGAVSEFILERQKKGAGVNITSYSLDRTLHQTQLSR
jgi:hypothetical protein